MSRLILYMAMSLDGFITGPGDDKGNPAGVGGMRLQEWLGDGGTKVADFRPAASQRQIVFDELMSTAPSSPGGGPATSPTTGVAIITTACRSSSRSTPLRRTIATNGCTS
jgi:hypothetical protein